MKITRTIADYRELRRSLKGRIGFVPTMGFLHEGHLSLIRRAQSECDVVVVSIFVNPIQLKPGCPYPEKKAHDIKACEENDVDVLFMPSKEEIYAPGFQTYVDVSLLSQKMEKASFPCHFRGVATVVLKLFNIILPDKAYFGQKDFQQSVLIKRMVKDLDYGLDIVVCGTVRDSSGLALSSRNSQLSPEEHKIATLIYKALTYAKQRFEDGVKDKGVLLAGALDMLSSEDMISVDFIDIVAPDTLESVSSVRKGDCLNIKATVGSTHLIDNILF